MRKNSKFPSQIYLKCWHRGIFECFWKYSIELTINQGLMDQYTITKEIYDHFESIGNPLDKEMRTNLEYIVLIRFKPNEKRLELEAVPGR
jgi:hypothetical protein